MATTTIATDHIQGIERVGREYQIVRPDGRRQVTDLISAPTKKDAAIMWYERELRRADESYTELIADHVSAAAIKVVGAALANGGAAMIDGSPDRMAPYLDAAEAIGMVSIGHSVNGGKYLMVARDSAGLDKIKSKLDKGELA